MYFIKNPRLLKKIYPSLIWDIPTAEKNIYLSFDDGPIPEVTPFVLETLKKFNAKASFFCIGDNVRKYPEIFQQIKEDGHTIGNHTFNHLNGWRTDTSVYMENIQKCNELTGTKLFRPPYGRILPSQIKAFKLHFPDSKIIMWDVLSGDFDQKIDSTRCYKNVIEHTIPGSIVVFHDSIKAFPRLKESLPKALEYWANLGYKFTAIN